MERTERIVYKGSVYDIQRDVNEPEYIFWDRAWYIIKNQDLSLQQGPSVRLRSASPKEKNCIQKSFIWANTKHLKCSYNT